MAVKLFNSIPKNIRHLELQQFKTTMKRILLSHSVYTIDEYFDIIKNFSSV